MVTQIGRIFKMEAAAYSAAIDPIREMPVTSLSNIALSGMQAAQVALNASAHNVANLGTEGFHRQQVVQEETPGGGVSTRITRSDQQGDALEEDIVAQLQAKNAFLANLKVFKTSSKMAGTLLDEKG